MLSQKTMYSTEYNITNEAPEIANNATTGKYLYYPDATSKRVYEGGMRCINRFKQGGRAKPLISVVTTVFNRELMVEKAICSILMQSYTNLEYIIIDAASDDGTLGVIQKYEDVIDYIISEPDGGIYEGMNKGVELAQGDYIIILNSDDWYQPDCIEKLINILLDKSLDVVCALAIETDMFGHEIRKIPCMTLGDNVYIRMPLRHETMLVSRRVYDSISLYDTDFKIIADLKFTQHLYDHTSDVYQLEEYLMFFRKVGVAHEVTNDLLAEREKLLLEQFPFLADADAKMLANDFSGNASKYLKLANNYPEEQKLIKGLKAFLDLRGALRKNKT